MRLLIFALIYASTSIIASPDARYCETRLLDLYDSITRFYMHVQRELSPHQRSQQEEYSTELNSLLWNCGAEDLWGLSHSPIIMRTLREFASYKVTQSLVLRWPNPTNKNRYRQSARRMFFMARSYNSFVHELTRHSGNDVDFLPLLEQRDMGSKVFEWTSQRVPRRREYVGDPFFDSQNSHHSSPLEVEMSDLSSESTSETRPDTADSARSNAQLSKWFQESLQHH